MDVILEHDDASCLIGAVMRDPSRRHGIAVTSEQFDHPGHSLAWRTVLSLAAEDDGAGLERTIHPDRVLQACPAIATLRGSVAGLEDVKTSHAVRLDVVFGAGNSGKAQYDWSACADRITAGWQARHMRDTYRSAACDLERGLYEGTPRPALHDASTRVSEGEHHVAGADPSRGVMAPQELGDATRAAMLERMGAGSPITGARSGWGYYDAVHKGCRPGRMGYTIAPTGAGKTSWLLNLGARLCDPAHHNDHEPVAGLYVNLEMQGDEVQTRLAAIRLGGAKSLNAIEAGDYADHHAEEVQRRTQASLLHVTDNAERTAGSVAALLAKYAVTQSIRFAVIDHLGEVSMTPQERREGAGWTHHLGWVRRWHALARRYGFALEVLGQCGRDDMLGKRGMRPSYRNVQGAAAVANHCDHVRILWADEGDEDMVLSIQKNRGGHAGVDIDFRFRATHGLWEERGRRRD